MPEILSSYEQVQAKKKEIAKRISGKTEVLTKVAKKYAPRKEEAEIDLARDIFYECLDQYREGDYTWKEFITELNKSLLAFKK